jgi:hypothetical protein
MAGKQMSTKNNDNQDNIMDLLNDWRRWLLGALLGGIAAWLIYFVAAPDYRSVATVVVDQNVEEAWTYFPDRQLFQFVRRETARLVELAWSDAVLAQVESELPRISQFGLRNGILQLSQPSDGGWHFIALHADEEISAKAVNSWAEAFVQAVQNAIVANPELQSARMELDALILNNPDQEDIELLAITKQITELAESTKGVSPYVELYVSDFADGPAGRSVSQASYLLVGSLIGAILAAIFFLLWPKNIISKRK